MSVSAVEAWRARPMTVRTLERCEHCSTLQEGVDKREHKNYWPAFSVTMKSCVGCFEGAKRRAAEAAREETYGYC